jgi:hypothetical protein
MVGSIKRFNGAPVLFYEHHSTIFEEFYAGRASARMRKGPRSVREPKQRVVLYLDHLLLQCAPQLEE